MFHLPLFQAACMLIALLAGEDVHELVSMYCSNYLSN
jgi:hypothetical protein